MARRALLIATGLALLGFAGFLLATHPRPGSMAAHIVSHKGYCGVSGRGREV